MRVLHVISGDLWAGAEAQAFTQLVALHEADVTVAAALMNDGELAQRLRARGIAVTVLDERRLSGAAILLALRKLMREWRPDVVHTHRSKENILGSLANRLAGKVPSVRTVHGANEDKSRGVRRMFREMQRYVDRWCGRHLQQRVIAVSAELSQKLERDFGTHHVVLIENGIDPEAIRRKVHPIDFRGSAPQATHIGIVGRLVEVKRVDLFLETAALLTRSATERDWRWHVIGDGPLRGPLVSRAQELALDKVTFHGHRNDIVACLASLDALVICSDHEGLPMVLLEALSVGTPIVAHATGGMVDVLRSSPLGLLVEKHTPAGYAAGLREMVERTVPPETSLPERFTAVHNRRALQNLYKALVHPDLTRELHG